MVFIRKTREYLLHLGAQEHTFHFAQDLRKEMTEAEKKLWNAIKSRKLDGLKFRRQHPIHWYVADFYCHEKRLIVEVDGEIHMALDVKDHDDNRSGELDRLGITVIRFTNHQIMNDLTGVLREIQSKAKSLESQ
jgi:very-short-patch-repair endonuclease